MLNIIGTEWKRAVLLKNKRGEAPGDMLTPLMERMVPEVRGAHPPTSSSSTVFHTLVS